MHSLPTYLRYLPNLHPDTPNPCSFIHKHQYNAPFRPLPNSIIVCQAAAKSNMNIKIATRKSPKFDIATRKELPQAPNST